MPTRIFSRHARSVTVTLSIFALLIFAGCGEEEKPAGVISGTVKSGEKIIGDCNVAFYNVESMGSIAATVDESGAFEVGNVPFGKYLVKVYPPTDYGTEAVPDP